MLETEFYRTALDTPGLIPNGQDRNEIELIHANESAHRTLVKKTIEDLGGTPRNEPVFDFSGGSAPGGPGFGMGPYATPSPMARRLKPGDIGGAPNLMSNNAVLEAALNIHS